MIVTGTLFQSFVSKQCLRYMSSQPRHSKLIVIGGGAGGLSIASRMARELPKSSVAVIEPRSNHYYQPLWTLVGGGIKTVAESRKKMWDVMPKEALWIQEEVKAFYPERNEVKTKKGEIATYEYLVVATGIERDLERIPGLKEALYLDTSGVCSNYSHTTAAKTWDCIRTFEGGRAIFTFPSTPVKCAGAPQKIMYLAEDHWRKVGRRQDSEIVFMTALDKIFTAPKYADRLMKIIQKRGIDVNFGHNLVRVDGLKKEAVFENLNDRSQVTLKFDMLHVTPPQKAASVLAPLADSTGFVNVNKNTLQHQNFPNIFALGDCTNLPTSKTAAAVAGQSGILCDNLKLVMSGKEPTSLYDGYTSCPLVTSYNSVILAEFDYSLNPKETFPFDQGEERRSMFWLKKEFFPFLYWNFMIK